VTVVIHDCGPVTDADAYAALMSVFADPDTERCLRAMSGDPEASLDDLTACYGRVAVEGGAQRPSGPASQRHSTSQRRETTFTDAQFAELRSSWSAVTGRNASTSSVEDEALYREYAAVLGIEP
jgi:hypothetical protein